MTIATFWISTAVVEIAGSPGSIARVKTLIPWGFAVLIPALALTARTGIVLAGGGATTGPSGRKLRRTKLAAANGVLVLVPSALYLASKATTFAFDWTFFLIQAVELSAGAANLVMLGLNARDGLLMTGRLRRRRSQRPPRCPPFVDA